MPVRDYELVLVMKPSADDEAVTNAVERVRQFVTEHGGTIAEEERWGMRRLAYPIQNFREGNYILTRFQLDGTQTRELDRIIKLQEDVLRHLLVKLDS